MEKQERDVMPIQEEDPDDVVKFRARQLEQDVRETVDRHKIEKRILERNNTKLLVRIEELERERDLFKEKLSAATELSTLALPRSAPPSTREPSSSATAPTQEATIPFKEYKELECKYNALFKQNDALRENADKIAKQLEAMKARVKEWSVWAAKRREKDRSEKGKKKAFRELRPDSELPPTSASFASPIPGGQQARTSAGDEEMHQQIAEQASSFLVNHDSPLKNLPVPSVLAEVESKERLDRQELSTAHDSGRANRASEGKGENQIQLQSRPVKLHSSQATQDETQQPTNGGAAGMHSNQSTQDASFNPTVDAQIEGGNPRSDNEEPVVVSERSLKRKNPAQVEVYQDTTTGRSERPTRVKKEPQDTQHVSQAIPSLLNRASTLDLDEVGLQIETPRKRRRIHELAKSSPGQAGLVFKRPALQHERSSSAPVAFSKAIVGTPVKMEAQDENFVTEVPDSNPIPADEEFEDVHGDANNVVKTRSPTNPRKAKALRPRDANARVQPQVHDIRPRRSRRDRDEERAAKAVPMLSEDGEETQIRESSPSVMLESRRRLDECMNYRPTEKVTLSSPRTPITRSAGRPTPKTYSKKVASDSPPRPQRTTRSKKNAPAPQIETPQTSNKPTRTEARKSFQRAGTPLRQKPIEQLHSTDFKINPRANAGLDFAYNEVVRGREARRCLPGCTKAECCGRELRAMIEAGLNPPLPRNLWDPSQGSQQPQTEEERYLQWFLGDGYKRDRIWAMPAVQREDLLVQAKMKLLANQAGRHRQMHERSKTPPGFWRTDFPGTQELAKDREEARRLEREIVVERYREAMHDGGRWIFRDE